MNDFEDLLVRTMRDEEAWAMRTPADPVPAIRARARTQRRNIALVAAVAVVLAAAALAVPATLTRLAGPLPTATVPGDGLLPWAPRGDLTGDPDVLRSAAGTWRAPTGPVRLLYAGHVGPATVVILQARTADGGAVAQVTDGRLVAEDRLPSPLPAVLQLVDPAPAEFQARLLVPPDADRVAWGDAQGFGLGQDALGADGLVLLEKVLHDPPMTVVPVAAGRPVGTGVLPPIGHLPADPSPVVLTSSTWDPQQSGEPNSWTLADAERLAATLGGGPVRIAQLTSNDAGHQLSGDASVQPRFYEVQRDGVRYLASLVDVEGTPGQHEVACVHFEPYAGAGPNAFVARCPLPKYHDGVIAVLARRGYQVVSAAFGPTTVRAGAGDTLLIQPTGPSFPAQAGAVTLRDGQGQDSVLPVRAYQP